VGDKVKGANSLRGICNFSVSLRGISVVFPNQNFDLRGNKEKVQSEAKPQMPPSLAVNSGSY
jgi:hypothetical protein